MQWSPLNSNLIYLIPSNWAVWEIMLWRVKTFLELDLCGFGKSLWNLLLCVIHRGEVVSASFPNLMVFLGTSNETHSLATKIECNNKLEISEFRGSAGKCPWLLDCGFPSLMAGISDFPCFPFPFLSWFAAFLSCLFWFTTKPTNWSWNCFQETKQCEFLESTRPLSRSLALSLSPLSLCVLLTFFPTKTVFLFSVSLCTSIPSLDLVLRFSICFWVSAISLSLRSRSSSLSFFDFSQRNDTVLFYSLWAAVEPALQGKKVKKRCPVSQPLRSFLEMFLCLPWTSLSHSICKSTMFLTSGSS